MNDHAATVQQVPVILPALPKLTDLAQTFWEELLLGRPPVSKGEPVSPTVGGTGSRWS